MIPPPLRRLQFLGTTNRRWRSHTHTHTVSGNDHNLFLSTVLASPTASWTKAMGKQYSATGQVHRQNREGCIVQTCKTWRKDVRNEVINKSKTTATVISQMEHQICIVWKCTAALRLIWILSFFCLGVLINFSANRVFNRSHEFFLCIKHYGLKKIT